MSNICSRCGETCDAVKLSSKTGVKYCLSCYTTIRREKIKQKCVDYKGGKCQICGYKKSLRGLIFHHRDPSQKDFGIRATKAAATSWDVVKQELDKCDLLCSNCHAEVHDELDKEALKENILKEKEKRDNDTTSGYNLWSVLG
jgi:5-methylcytosine-specific restriction endonuclease McrA